MLLEEFDGLSPAVIDPQQLLTRREDFPEVTVACFSRELFGQVLSLFEARHTATLYSSLRELPVYEVEYKGRRFAFYQAGIGEPLAVGEYEELIALGSKRLILLGNCGVLDKSIEDCGIIIPTAALRDEGCSYHYLPPADEIEVNRKYRELFTGLLEEIGCPYISGKTWTTDAIYRETRDKAARRREQGAICVEMECAGMQALCEYRGTEFFQFFYAGDNLDCPDWQPRSVMGHTRLDDKCRIALLAFELGFRIMESEGL